MEYTINKLAGLAGVSTRTLRYYDQIGLLKPAAKCDNGYRVYGQKEVDRLQQILFYREMGFALEDIGRLLSSPDFDSRKALECHLSALLQKRKQIDLLIENVKKTISAAKGEITMSNKEQFEGFKQKLVTDNEAQYGSEIRKRFGDEAIDGSNARVMGMSEEAWQRSEALRMEMEGLLKAAFAQKDPAGEDAQKACDLHRQWLCMFWKEGAYTKEAHKSLGEGYVCDERFRAYYDKLAPGCAAFLRDSLTIYCAP